MEKVLLKKRSRHGSDLVWTAEVSDFGLLIKYGKEGGSLRSQTFPIKRCLDCNAGKELDVQVQSKIEDGYQTVAEFNHEMLMDEPKGSGKNLAQELQLTDDVTWF